jgi:hypothetical protein
MARLASQESRRLTPFFHLRDKSASDDSDCNAATADGA